jgi:hypothetical protein
MNYLLTSPNDDQQSRANITITLPTEHPFSPREKDRMRGYKIRRLPLSLYPLSPALSRRERGYDLMKNS